ncbi:MAG TPA: pitrilysin family protein, partial [Dissulfurispiraceae bacterium]|nr:pitrilysin family protein [Dissulfurispiraceae bacterium]
PNGLVVYHSERHNLPVVMVSLLIKASPLDELPGKAGVASMTSHMMTEGTSTRSSLQISQEIEFIGADLDASATKDYSTLSLSVLKKNVQKGFEVLSDVLLNPAFPEEELKRKRELVKGSLKRMEDEPSYVAEKTFLREVFGGHPYGRPVEGSVETIDTLTRDDVANFYRDHYRPDNAVLSVVGDVTQEELKDLLDRYLSPWKGRESPIKAEAVRPADKERKEPKLVIVNRDISQANIHLGHRGIARSDPDYYAVAVMNYILGGGGFASRLTSIVRDEMGLTYSIYSSFAGNKEPGQFDVEVQTKNESAGAVIGEIFRQMTRMKNEPVTDQELADAKSYLTGSFPRRLETSRKVADFLSVVKFYELGDDYPERYAGYINAVTKEDIGRVAQKYLHPDRVVIVIVGREGELRLADFEALKKVQ